jgi:hypothetical protein
LVIENESSRLSPAAREILAKLVDQVVVGLVRADPEPNHQIIVATRESTVVITYSD